ncbi:uncharacterized protein LOC132307416 [Cornus florida]|uniref:uncharacterized protein LOC132307416 n=1 Tax=Cornus florida TaxID=4283 RepID=UPI0028987AF0|nr:uncharacterized protein LOC132307416 [Cornus florida]
MDTFLQNIKCVFKLPISLFFVHIWSFKEFSIARALFQRTHIRLGSTSSWVSKLPKGLTIEVRNYRIRFLSSESLREVRDLHLTHLYTDKSDSFNFGVILGVLLTGRDPMDPFFEGAVTGGSLGRWLQHLQQEGEA